MPIPHWSKAPDVWDTVTLAGIAMPGVATVECSRKATIDKKKPKGKNKAQPTVQGVESAEVTIKIEVNTEDEWLALQAAIEKLEPKAGTGKDASSPVDIAHPVTASRGIRAILIEDLKGPIKPPTGNSFCHIEIKAMEFVAPAKPTGTGGKATGNAADYPYVGTFTTPDNVLFYETAKVDPTDISSSGKGDTGFHNFISSHGKKFFAKFIIGVPKADTTDDALKKLGKTPGDVTTTPDAAKGGDTGDKPKAAGPPDPATADTAP